MKGRTARRKESKDCTEKERMDSTAEGEEGLHCRRKVRNALRKKGSTALKKEEKDYSV